MIAKFVNGLYVENGNIPEEFDWVQEFTCIISEKIDGEYLYHSSLQNLKKNYWFCFNRSFFWDAKIQWFCFVPGRGMVLVEEIQYDAKEKLVRIDLETDSFHEAQIWADVCLEFKRKHNCKLIIGAKASVLLRISKCRKDLIFIDSSSDCDPSLYAKYDIGRFDRDDSVLNLDHTPGWLTQNWWRYYRSDKNPSLFEYQHSEDIARDILGLQQIRGFFRENLDVDHSIKYNMSSLSSPK